jgi:hypothetical protein
MNTKRGKVKEEVSRKKTLEGIECNIEGRHQEATEGINKDSNSMGQVLWIGNNW